MGDGIYIKNVTSLLNIYIYIYIYIYLDANKTKRLEKKLDGNYTRMLRAILNKSWRQHPTKHQLYGHLPDMQDTAGDSRDELLSDVLLWTPTYGRATYIQQLCEDTRCSLINDREKWRERIRDIRTGGTTWWWWWWWCIKERRYVF